MTEEREIRINSTRFATFDKNVRTHQTAKISSQVSFAFCFLHEEKGAQSLLLPRVLLLTQLEAPAAGLRLLKRSPVAHLTREGRRGGKRRAEERR